MTVQSTAASLQGELAGRMLSPCSRLSLLTLAALLTTAAAGWGDTVTLERAVISLLACLGVRLQPGPGNWTRAEDVEDNSVKNKFEEY